jgi:NAD(P)-dependent dehydrogenase (short-subunit alcohol dehydrogenase family)
MSPYNTSKHAVIGIMRCAAKEVSGAGIRVNTVNPGPIEGRMMGSIETGMAPGTNVNVHAAFEAQIPAGRYGQPLEIANLTLFLASDESSYCTGAVFSADGGIAKG